VAISTAFCMVVFAAIELLRRSFNAVDWLAFGLTYAFFSYIFPIGPQNYDLEIDEDAIRLLRNGVVKRTLQKGRVHYVRESNDGQILVISEHGPVWTRLWGGVPVPKSLSDYEEIKARVLSWL
jgi:hypothetical protein